MLAGALAIRLHKRPTELLGIHWSPYEDLMLDSEILERVDEEMQVASAEENQVRTVPSLLSEIKAKRRRWIYRGEEYG